MTDDPAAEGPLPEALAALEADDDAPEDAPEDEDELPARCDYCGEEIPAARRERHAGGSTAVRSPARTRT